MFNTITSLFPFRAFRSLCESLVAIRGQENRETKDTYIQMHAEPGVQRSVFIQRAVGENSRMFVGRDGDGL